jgi:hypothetical protein
VIQFLLLWLLAVTIVFSIEMILGSYWYEYVYKKIPLGQKASLDFLSEKYSQYLKISLWWFLFIICFLSGLTVGWFAEKHLKVLSKMNHYWQQKQPEFYRNTKGENRVFLPWLIVELPILIIAIINVVLLVTFKSYTTPLLATLFFTGGFTLGQLVEGYIEYKNILEMDRPEQKPKSILQKFKPNISDKYSLFLGQFYTKALVPFFFLYLSIFVPLKLVVFRNSDDMMLLTIMVSILLGLSIRWYIERENIFYFGKVTIENVAFTVVKLLLILFFIAFILHNSQNPYIPAIVCIFAGYSISWHPEYLRR